ncbi:MAG: SCO family protein [Actinobacteria bacterium]|nr:SCO family protein [Actinomycetota bacterium]MCA1720039.1 SCO family protein [Actinomycetota bacterium]
MRRLGALLVIALLATGCAGEARTTESLPVKVSYHGVEPLPVPSRPSFVLRDTAGNPYDFTKETAGRPTFVYFGYTHCPDECPTAMADIAASLRKVEPALREKVRVVFVTTDAARDTGPVVRRFLDQWSTEYVGLVGTQPELDAAARAAGVVPGRVGPAPSTAPGQPAAHEHEAGTAPHEHVGPLGYSVSHSAVIYAYDAKDRLPVVYPGGVTPSDIAADLPVLART